MSTWLPSLITDTPEAGFDLAVTLAKKVLVIRIQIQLFVKNYVQIMPKTEIV